MPPIILSLPGLTDRVVHVVPLARLPEPDYLLALVRRVAEQDHVAFAHLYDAVAGHLLEVIHSMVPDPQRAAAVASATFVEVWLLARFHTDADADIFVWLINIAARRIADRLPLGAEHRRQIVGATAEFDIHDRQTHLTLVALLDRSHLRAGVTSGAESGPT